MFFCTRQHSARVLQDDVCSWEFSSFKRSSGYSTIKLGLHYVSQKTKTNFYSVLYGKFAEFNTDCVQNFISPIPKATSQELLPISSKDQYKINHSFIQIHFIALHSTSKRFPDRSYQLQVLSLYYGKLLPKFQFSIAGFYFENFILEPRFMLGPQSSLE